jgi:hypothetical protein
MDTQFGKRLVAWFTLLRLLDGDRAYDRSCPSCTAPQTSKASGLSNQLSLKNIEGSKNIIVENQTSSSRFN